MSRVAAWSIITGASFLDVIDDTVAAHVDNMDLFLQTVDGNWVRTTHVDIQLMFVTRKYREHFEN